MFSLVCLHSIVYTLISTKGHTQSCYVLGSSTSNSERVDEYVEEPSPIVLRACQHPPESHSVIALVRMEFYKNGCGGSMRVRRCLRRYQHPLLLSRSTSFSIAPSTVYYDNRGVHVHGVTL